MFVCINGFFIIHMRISSKKGASNCFFITRVLAQWVFRKRAHVFRGILVCY